MSRLFSGTKWDRPPSCERCQKPETDCECPPLPLPASGPARLAPEAQTAKIQLEKRAKGKVVTVVAGLDLIGNDLHALAATLKAKCGAGGTVKDDHVELQGDHLAAADAALRKLGYQTRVRK